jgi:hypothetical protein
VDNLLKINDDLSCGMVVSVVVSFVAGNGERPHKPEKEKTQ